MHTRTLYDDTSSAKDKKLSSDNMHLNLRNYFIQMVKIRYFSSSPIINRTPTIERPRMLIIIYSILFLPLISWHFQKSFLMNFCKNVLVCLRWQSSMLSKWNTRRRRRNPTCSTRSGAALTYSSFSKNRFFFNFISPGQEDQDIIGIRNPYLRDSIFFKWWIYWLVFEWGIHVLNREKGKSPRNCIFA